MKAARKMFGPIVFGLVCITSIPASGPISHGVLADTLMITSPQGAVTWLSSGQDTIRWTSAGIDNVDIFYSVNFENGTGNFQNLAASFPADSGQFVWNIPAGMLSRKCAIFIRDGDNPSFSDTSEVFRIKGYIITRVDPNGDYEAYRVEEDSWDFSNIAGSIWPSGWYQQFNYRTGTDPFTGSPYSPDFVHWSIGAKSPDFPDWPAFVRAFGTGQSYVTVNSGGIVSPWALLYWGLNKDSFTGAAGSFAGTSFLAWDNKPGFLSRFNVPDFGTDLRESPLNASSRRALSQGWACQFGEMQRNTALLTLTNSANDALGQVKEMLFGDSGNNKAIQLYKSVPNFPPILGHAVNAWKIEDHPSNPDIEYIYVYDSNGAGMYDLRVEINTALNTWKYSSYTGTLGIGFMLPSGSYLQDVFLPQVPANPAFQAGGPFIELYNTANASIVITDTAGNSIVCDNVDSVYSNTIPSAVANVPPTGRLTIPVGYFLPDNSYSAVMSDFPDTSMHFAVFADSTVLVYGRTDAAIDQQDILSYGSGIGVSNPDATNKEANFLALLIGQGDQKQFDLTNLSMAQSDSMHFSTLGSDMAEIVNVGSAKTYGLALKHAIDTTQTTFDEDAVILEANSTHQIVPDWIEHAIVTIYVDLGNDGTIDDTLVIGGTVSVGNTAGSGVPQEYSLSQNYPNPFNPSTVIGYQVSTASHVALRVYDVLGRQVATLVDEVQDAGFRNVSFDAARLSSGVYYYRIDMRSLTTNEAFTDVKRMMIVK